MSSRSFSVFVACVLLFSANAVASTPDKTPAKAAKGAEPAAKPVEKTAKPTAKPEAKPAAKPAEKAPAAAEAKAAAPQPSAVAPEHDKKPAKAPAKAKVAADAAPPAAKSTKSGDGAATGAACEIKAGTGVEAHVLQGEATSFPAGSKVWAWSKVSGQAGQVASHVWKHEGKVVRTARLPIKQASYSTNSRATVRSGSYVVECTDADGKVLGSVAFSVAKS